MTTTDTFNQVTIDAYKQFFDNLGKIGGNSAPSTGADVAAAVAAAANDFSDQMAENIARHFPNSNISPAAMRKILAKANAAVAAVLEIPESPIQKFMSNSSMLRACAS